MTLAVRVEEKRYAQGGRPDSLALQHLTLQAAPGEWLCLVGPSGCGKSTLLNIIGGLDPHYRGRVTLDGRPPCQEVSYVFQTPRLMPWLSVLDNVTLVLAGVADAKARATKLLSAMDLGDYLHQYPNRLSGGMQRRVALARGFAPNPRLLLLDEPFISLDHPVAQRLRAMLVALWQEQRTTVLFVTHDLAEAIALGDRVVFLSPRPGTVIRDLPVPLVRPRSVDDPLVAELQRQWLATDPELLAGRSCKGDSP